ncbi:MAG: signal transduction histidine kinase [Planctomycetota bacterium]|jgi:signal transduction histidine kinase
MKLRSLRQRLGLAMGLSLVLMLLAVAVMTSRGNTHELRVFLEDELPQFREGPPDLGPYLEELEAIWRVEGEWRPAQELLEQIERDFDRRYYFILSDVSDPHAGDHRVLRHEVDSVRFLEGSTEPPRAAVGNVMLPGGMSDLSIEDDDGRVVGQLTAIPKIDAPGPDVEKRLIGALNNWLMISLLAAGVLGWFVIIVVSKRVVQPLEKLTEAVHSMSEGDLEQRLDVRSQDEIGVLGLAFNRLSESLLRSERTRRNMVGDVAHELRTPLTNVRCQLEAMQDGIVEPNAEMLASLHEETVHLGKLVDDLQELSLAEAGALRLEPEDLDVAEELRRCLARLPEIKGAPTPRLEAQELPPLRADRTRFHQIVTNLLCNARDHTPAEGEIVVSARVVDRMIEIDVRDSGRGMDAKGAARVFGRFYRTDPSRTRSTGGAGLGLAIVKQLVESQGGSVGLESELGQGSRFWFRLPLSS